MHQKGTSAAKNVFLLQRQSSLNMIGKTVNNRLINPRVLIFMEGNKPNCFSSFSTGYFLLIFKSKSIWKIPSNTVCKK